MGIKKTMESIKSVDECSMFLRSFLKDGTSLYSKVYSNYENSDWSKQIKAYSYKDEMYAVVISEISNKKIDKLKVGFTKKKPKEPHPVFPILDSFAPHCLLYEYTRGDNVEAVNG